MFSCILTDKKTRCTRGVCVVFSATRMRSSNSARINKSDFITEQDAREAMRVVFSVLTKRICMHKTKFLMNIFKYCFKNDIK